MQRDRPQQDRPALADDILSYLVQRPDAQDTLDGITEWWVLENCIQRRVGEVREALEILVAEGILVAERRPGSETAYRIRRTRLTDVRLRLRATPETRNAPGDGG